MASEASNRSDIPRPRAVFAGDARFMPPPYHGSLASKAASRALSVRYRVADFVEAALQGELINAFQRQSGENRNAIAEHAQGIGKGQMLFGLVAFEGGGIWKAPMGSHGLTWPMRTLLRGSVITEGKDKIERRGIGCREFVPALRAEPFSLIIGFFQSCECVGIDLALRLRPRTERSEPALTQPVELCFSHNRARRIARAEKQHIVDFLFVHGVLPLININNSINIDISTFLGRDKIIR